MQIYLQKAFDNHHNERYADCINTAQVLNTVTKTITQGRYTANIRRNGEGDFLVIVTRDGDCLPGIPSKHYSDLKRATMGANRMLAKAAQ